MNDRRAFLGGSDVAGVLGLSPWASPWSVYAEKVGLVDDSFDESERLALGKDAEHYLSAVFTRRHPDLYLGGAQAELTHPDYPWLRGHADGFVLESPDSDVSDAIAGWEAKTDNSLKPWESVPVYYQCQAQTYMLLTGLPEWRFTVGFAGWRVEEYLLLADENDQRLIVERTREFWERHVLTGDPPPVDDHPATTTALNHAWPDAESDPPVEADEELVAVVRELDAVRAHIRADKKRAEALENIVKARLQDRTELVYDGALVCSWRPQERRGLDAARVRAEHGDAYDTHSTFRKMLTHLPKKERQPTP